MKVSSDIYFNVASWFPENILVKPHLNTQWSGHLHLPHPPIFAELELFSVPSKIIAPPEIQTFHRYAPGVKSLEVHLFLNETKKVSQIHMFFWESS